jgi:lysozyme
MPPTTRLPSFYDKLAKQLEEEEGFRAQVYQDSLGYWTIGIGRLVDPTVEGSGISRDEALVLLGTDIRETEEKLDKALPWWRELSEIRQRVLISMCFNLGLNGLLGFRNTLPAIQRGDWETAARGMENSLWYRQTKNRAKRLVMMMRTNEDHEKWW